MVAPSMANLNIAIWLASLLPILVLALPMIFLRWSLLRSGLLAMATSLILSFTVFKANGFLVELALEKGLFLGFFVGYIIFAGLFLYNMVEGSGGLSRVSEGFAGVTQVPVLQTLILGWALVSFIQGVTGIGVGIAVVSPMLVKLGMKPLKAVACSAVGHAWSVTFGSMGSSFFTLILVANYEPARLAFWSSIMLGTSCILTGVFVAYIHGGFSSVKKGLPAILIMGPAMAIALYAVTSTGSYATASIVAGLVGIGVGVLVSKLPVYRLGAVVDESASPKTSVKSFHFAFSPYYVLVVISVVASWPSAFSRALSDFVVFARPFPETSTGLGWVNEAVSSYSPIKFLTHPGTLILEAAFIGYVILKSNGWSKGGMVVGAFNKTVSGSIAGIVGVFLMSMVATVMNDSGMSFILANGVASTGGVYYPLAAATVGALGAFTTGSNTASNALFGFFQRTTAKLIGADQYVVGASQTAGGALGGMISPLKMVLGTTSVGALGQEGSVLKMTIVPLLVFLIIIGVMTQLWSF